MSQLAYQAKLVAIGLRRDRGYSSVMIISLAMSVSLLVTALTAYRRFGSSAVVRLPNLYRVQPRHNPLQPFYANTEFSEFASFASFVVGARLEGAVAASTIPSAHATSFVAGLDAGPAGQPSLPIAARFCDAELFTMFPTRFQFGRAWASGRSRHRPGNDGPSNAVVLSAQLNQSWFQGADSVGRSVLVDGRLLTVVGVLAPPATAFELWDFNPFPDRGELLLPADLAEALRPMPHVMFPPSRPGDWSALVAGTHRFMESWVSFSDDEARGRFAAAMAELDPTVELVTADELIRQLLQPPPQYAVFALFAVVLVAANVLNAVRLLFARALARAAELGVHRALGAPRRALFTRHVMESVAVVAGGATLGLALGMPMIRLFDSLIPDLRSPLSIDPSSLGWTWLLCVALALLAGLYPAIRVAFVLPTRYLGRV